jgi:aspartate aminotransferase-like enzyme
MTLLEYSVIYTNRATNLMSQSYKNSFKKLNHNLCHIYNAKKTLIIPGSGSNGMEAVARQFGVNKKCMIMRNGFFSYRWSQILDHGKPYNITDNTLVHQANINILKNNMISVSPPKISELYDSILKYKPDLICAPHVETSTGVILPNEYIKEIGNAAKKVGSIFCLDGIASGTMWVDMKKLNIDLYITAPQKGWSSQASSGVIMLGDRAIDCLNNTMSNSFILDLNKWSDVTDAYNNDNFMYHCTVPTDSIINFSETVEETLNFGLTKAQDNAEYIGKKIRKLLELKGYNSIAADKYKSPTVIVSQCSNSMVEHFKEKGMQVTGFVPFMLDEPKDTHTFRIGLFGLDKLSNPEKTIDIFKKIL